MVTILDDIVGNPTFESDCIQILENNKKNSKEIETLCSISIDMLNEETKKIRIYKDNLGGYIEKLKNNNYLLLIDRSYFEDSKVEKLEKMLYQFYKDENLIEYIK